MKCPKCWAEKAYVHETKGLRGFLHRLALLAPMKCHHCYHKFVVSRLLIIGEQIHPPRLRIAPMSPDTGASGDASRGVGTRRSPGHRRAEGDRRRSGRADAA